MRIPTFSSSVQLIDPGAIQQPGATGASGLTNAFGTLSATVGQIANKQLGVLARVELKRKQDEAAALVVSTEAEAFDDWSTQLGVIRSKHRKDPSKATFAEISDAKNGVLEDFTTFANNWVFDRISSTPTPEARIAMTKSLGKFRFDMIRQTIKQETETTKDLYKGALKHGLDYESIRMQQDPARWKEFYDSGLRKIRAAGVTFLSPLDSFNSAKEFDLNTARTVSDQWFRDNGGRLNDLEALRTGEFNDPDINGLWSGIPAKQRHSLYTSGVNEYLKRLTLEDRVQKDNDEVIKRDTDGLILDFYDPSIPNAKKSTIMYELKSMGLLTAAQYIKMQQDLDGAAAVTDNNAVLAAKIAIANGEVTSYKGLLDLDIDARTISNVIVPFFEAHRDEDFREATSYLRTELGMPPGAFEFLDPKVNRRAELRALSDLTKFRRNNPSGDFFVEAERLVGDYHKAKKTQSDVVIDRLKRERDAFGQAGKTDEADALQRRINFLENR